MLFQFLYLYNKDNVSVHNIPLSARNRKLRQENNYLRNYISKTFEVVKHFFDFPVDKLKMVVSNFIKSYEK